MLVCGCACVRGGGWVAEAHTCGRVSAALVLTIVVREQIIQMVMNTQESMDRSAQDAVKMLNSLDEDGNGRVSLEEFQVGPWLVVCWPSWLRVTTLTGCASPPAPPRKKPKTKHLASCVSRT